MVQSDLHLHLAILFTGTHNNPYILAERPGNEVTLTLFQKHLILSLYIL